ncbi:MAG TPA: PKD domain-containing protein [Bacteroidia bacterium]|jgi:hypothetical protein|nr:PKD domain-containing protein [Bacteroidia bacterium]HQF27244.1 PKD domain-containing protein [Bacteroidia bacterium]HQK96721.1 PKD domain-containing protein [Bacteroidia bacterium]
MKFKIFCFFLLSLMLSAFQGQSQQCIGASNLKHGKGIFYYLDYVAGDQIIAVGTYFTSTQGYFAMDGDTLFPNPGDLVTAYAVVMDTNFNVIRMFNVIGLNDLGGAFNNTRIWDMTVDDNKNIYVVGAHSQDTLTAGNDTIIGEDYLECFIAGVDSMGNHILLKSFGSRSWTSYVYEDAINAVACDHAGNIYVTGNFGGNYMIINNDTVNNPAIVGVNGKPQIFTAALTPTGQTIWLRQCGAAQYDDLPLGIEVDNLGSVVISGSTEASNADFLFGTHGYHYKSAPSSFQGFVARYGPGGVEKWLYPIESYTGNGPDVSGYDVATDEAGNTYAMGFFDGYAVFNQDTIRPLYGYTSSFLIKLDSTGNRSWLKTGRIDTFYPFPGKLAFKDDHLFITGQTYTNQLWFDQLAVCCSNDVYFAMYDTTGTLQWLKSGQTAGSANLYSTSVAIGKDGRGYAAGQASNGQVTFEPNTFNALSTGEYYIIRFGDLPSNGLAINIQNNTGTDTVACGGYIALQGIVTPSSLSSTAKYYWYADNDTMTFTFPAATLNATPKVNSTYIVTAYAGGCVASDTIGLFVNQLPFSAGLDTAICFGTTIPLSATTYSGAHYSWVPSLGLSNDTAQNPVLTGISSTQYIAEMNSAGCISRDTFDIFVNPLPLADYTYSANYLAVDFNDISTSSTNNSWDFGDGVVANQVITVQHIYTNTGTYTACLTVQNDCGADTICKTFTITNVGLNEFGESSGIDVKEDIGSFNINSKSKLKEIEVVSISGAVQIKASAEQLTYRIEKNNLSAGIYLVRITNESGIFCRKMQVIR